MKVVFQVRARWAPAAPGGFPHYSDADDEYKGYKVGLDVCCVAGNLPSNYQWADCPQDNDHSMHLEHGSSVSSILRLQVLRAFLAPQRRRVPKLI